MRHRPFFALLSACLAISACAAASTPPKPPENPVEIAVAVEPTAAAPGERVSVSVSLTPVKGIKLNKYPKITLAVPESAGLSAGASTEVGNDAPPPPDQPLDGNYFKAAAPLSVDLELDPAIAPGSHSFDGKLRYFYCVVESGFCAPKNVTLQIPVKVEN